MVPASARRRPLSGALHRAEAGIGTRRGGAVVFIAAVAVFAVESIGLPIIPGRDFGTYLRFYLQLGDWHSVFPMSMLFRTPLAPILIGVPLDLGGGWAVEVVFTVLFGLSVLAWTRVALAFGSRVALLTAVALTLYPGYGILFHGVASDAVAAAAFAGWALALTRAVRRPTPLGFALVGVTVAAAALARPGNQGLIAVAVVPLVLALPWRRRLACMASCVAVAVVVLGAWAVNNGLRYDDYTVARGGKAYLPFFRAYTSDHIVEPGNGPASRALAAAVQKDLLTQEPYRSYGVTLHDFFARGSDREFEDLIGLSDRVWGWNSDYSELRKAGIEAVRAHPGTYARGVTTTVLRELWHPLFVALPAKRAPAVGGASASSSSAGASNDTTVVDGKRLPRPSGGDMIPAAHQGFYSTTPHGTIREVWTSPTAHTVVLSTPAQQRRFDVIDRDVARLASRLPPYGGSSWLTEQFSRSSKLFPPPLLWLVAGIAGFAIRRPRGALLAAALALGALVLTVVNALMIYSIIAFAIPLAPALVVVGAAGLVGERRAAGA
jgi:hypothetical protein